MAALATEETSESRSIVAIELRMDVKGLGEMYDISQANTRRFRAANYTQHFDSSNSFYYIGHASQLSNR